MNGSDSSHPWPKISVVTPVRNSVETLRDTIQSILAQDYPNLEYVVIDGGSTDGSLEIIYDYAAHIDAFLYGRDKNLYDALAKAFSVCHGDVFAWLNADDMYEPDILRRVGRIFGRHPTWDVVYYDGTVSKQRWRVPNRNQRPVGLPELMQGHILYQDSVFFRRRAYEMVGGIDQIRFRLAGDYDFWLRLAERFAFHYIPETASCFGIRTGQLSGDWNAYVREMDLARSQARRRQSEQRRPRASRLPAVWLRKRAAARMDKHRPFNYPLRDENLNWPSVVSNGFPELSSCRCVICGDIPSRLLFSTPDTWYGDRRIWRYYYCVECHACNLFPSPSADEYQSLVQGICEKSCDTQPNPGSYRLFSGPQLLTGNPFYARVVSKFPSLQEHASDLPRIRENRNAALLEIGCGEGVVLKHLAKLGYRNLAGFEENIASARSLRSQGFEVQNTDFISACPSDSRFDAAILHLTLETLRDPTAALRQLHRALRRRGRVYIVTPNLDSIWLSRYGPAWSRWHAPFHRFLFSPAAIRKLATKTGFRVHSIRSCSPPAWLYQSDLLSAVGLGGSSAPPDPADRDEARWSQALGASVLAAARWDWRLRGDCLHATLIR
jgi:glycosyltransferase involved in cell wall biosynthesis/SAM-dependent methyltransferase